MSDLSTKVLLIHMVGLTRQCVTVLGLFQVFVSLGESALDSVLFRSGIRLCEPSGRLVMILFLRVSQLRLSF